MTKRTLIILAALLVVTSIPAFATTTGGTDTKSLPVSTDVTLNLPKFDTALGTLTNVWVQLELRLTGASVELDNDGDLATTGTGYVVNTASLTSSVSLLKAVTFDTINNGDLTINASNAYSLGATTGDAIGVFNATGLGDYAHWQPGTLLSGDSGDIADFVWAGYKGTGNFTITVNSLFLTSATFAGGGGSFHGNSPEGELCGRVVYTYQPVPEPTTIGLLSLGAMSLIRKRKVSL
jgi:hypothetical protein